MGGLTVCMHCQAVNRLAAGKGAHALCGKCGAGLSVEGSVSHLGDQELSRLIGRPGVVVVDFWAAWCGPCQMFGPTFSEVAHKRSSQASFVKVDTEQHQSTMARLGIRGIPTVVIFKDGKEVSRQSGAMSKAQFDSMVSGVF